MSEIARKVAEQFVRIDAENPSLNAYLRTYPETARDAAQASDRRRAEGATLGPLDGVMLAIKDNLAVAGAPWTAGVEGRRHTIADTDATAVSALREAGAIVLGSTNLEEGALGTMTDIVAAIGIGCAGAKKPLQGALGVGGKVGRQLQGQRSRPVQDGAAGGIRVTAHIDQPRPGAVGPPPQIDALIPQSPAHLVQVVP